MLHDSHKFNVDGETKEQLAQTLELLLTLADTLIHAFRIDANTGEMFYYTRGGDSSRSLMPKTRNVETLANLAWDWLSDPNTEATFRRNNPEPGIDGTIEPCWNVSLDSSSFEETIRISHTWAIYRK